MNQSKSWKLFIVVIGLLTICASYSTNGIDQPTFFGGVITTVFGLFLFTRDKKR